MHGGHLALLLEAMHARAQLTLPTENMGEDDNGEREGEEVHDPGAYRANFNR